MNLGAPRLKLDSSGFSLADQAGRIFLAHSPEFPLFYMGTGSARISMNCGNFDIRDDIRELRALRDMRQDTARASFSGRFSLPAADPRYEWGFAWSNAEG